jgi:hypothetical protein
VSLGQCTHLQERTDLFSDFPILLDMQIMNGLVMGKVLQSDNSCADIAKHISQSKIRLFQYTVEVDLKWGNERRIRYFK